MTLEEIYQNGFKFEIEGKSCEFDMITYDYALKAQNAMYLLSTDKVEKGNEIIAGLALKFLKVENKRVDNNESLALIFKNPLVIIEINAQFLNYINVFLKSLPSFQNLK